MMDRREFEGEDLQRALSKAAVALHVREEDLRYEILQEGRRGFLGVGVRAVRIRILPPGGEIPADDPEVDTGGSSEEPEAEPLNLEAARIREFLGRFADSSPFRLGFQVTEEPERIRVELEGPDRDLFLARRGEALQGLQVVLGRVASQNGSRKAIFADCSGFRRQREIELAEIAVQTAEKVKKLGEPQRLSPMNPYDRRQVHLALKDDPAVETRSEGEGLLKQIVIYPRASGGAPPPAEESK